MRIVYIFFSFCYCIDITNQISPEELTDSAYLNSASSRKRGAPPLPDTHDSKRSLHSAISTNSNNLATPTSSKPTSTSLPGTVPVKSVIASMLELIKGSVEAEKKILCLECHTKIKWVEYFTHDCQAEN